MPKRSGPERILSPALKRGVVFDTVRGKARIRKWPNPRGLGLHPHTRYMNKWFQEASFNIKRLAPQYVNIAIQMTKGTGLYPRDILLKAATRPFYHIAQPDGSILKPKRIGLQEVSFQGARVTTTSDLAVGSGAWAAPQYDSIVLDTVGIFDPGFNTGFIIPQGVNVVSVIGGLISNGSTGSRLRARIIKNGASELTFYDASSSGTRGYQTSSGPIPVLPGDTLEAQWFSNGGWTIAGLPETFMSIEILDANIPAP